MFCVGTHRRQMDEKLRISLPKALKSFLRDGKFGYLTPGLDGGLELHNEQSLQTRAEEIRGRLSDYAQRSAFERLFFAQTNAVELDGHGRLRLPSTLAEPAGLDSTVVLVGTGGHWEIWASDRWDSYMKDERHNELLGVVNPYLANDSGSMDGSNDAADALVGFVASDERSAAAGRPGKPGKPR